MDLPSTLMHIVLTENQLVLREKYPDDVKIENHLEWEQGARQFLHYNEYHTASTVRTQIAKGEADRKGYAKTTVSLLEAFLRNYGRVDLARSTNTDKEFSALTSLAITSLEENLELPKDRLTEILKRLHKIVPYANKNSIKLDKKAVYRLCRVLRDSGSSHSRKTYNLFRSIVYSKGESVGESPGRLHYRLRKS